MALSGSLKTSGGYEGRNYTLSWTASQSIANNTSTISWSLSCSGGSASWYAERTLYVAIAGTVVVNKTDRVQRYSGKIASGTITLNHANDGTKSFSAEIKAAVYYSTVNATASNTFTLDTIPRASSISVGTLTMGTAGNISVTRASSSFTHTITYSWGNSTYSESGTICTKSTATSVSWTPSLNLAKAIPSAVSGVGTLTCTTYNGNTAIGTKSITFTCNVPSSVVPTISNLVATLDNSANSVIAGWALAVAGFTKVKLTASASGSYGSTISSFTITGGYSTTVTGTSLNYTGAKITSSGTKTFTIYATDSRGRKSSTLATSVIFYAYSNPTISNFLVSRNAQKGTDIDVTYAKSFSSVNGKNAVTGTLKYKKHSDSSWTTYGIVASGTHTLSDNPNTTAIEFEEAASYDFQLSLTDTVGNSATATAFISTLAVLMDFRAGGKGLGIGKIAETDNMEVALDAIFMGNIYIQDSVGNKKTLAEYIKSVMSS